MTRSVVGFLVVFAIALDSASGLKLKMLDIEGRVREDLYTRGLSQKVGELVGAQHLAMSKNGGVLSSAYTSAAATGVTALRTVLGNDEARAKYAAEEALRAGAGTAVRAGMHKLMNKQLHLGPAASAIAGDAASAFTKAGLVTAYAQRNVKSSFFVESVMMAIRNVSKTILYYVTTASMRSLMQKYLGFNSLFANTAAHSTYEAGRYMVGRERQRLQKGKHDPKKHYGNEDLMNVAISLGTGALAGAAYDGVQKTYQSGNSIGVGVLSREAADVATVLGGAALRGFTGVQDNIAPTKYTLPGEESLRRFLNNVVNKLS